MARSGSRSPAPRWALAALPLALAFAASAAPANDQQQPEQQSATISNRDRVVITGMVPIPDVGEGAPRFTSKDVEVLEKTFRDTEHNALSDILHCSGPQGGLFRPCDEAAPFSLGNAQACEVEHARKAATFADRAAEATHAAEDVRRAAMVGQADQAAVEAGELKRQSAVSAMQKERETLLEWQAKLGAFQELRVRGRKDIDEVDILVFMDKAKKAGWGLGLAQPDTPKGLALTGVKAVQLTDKKGDYVLLQGKITNNLGRAVPVPPLQASLVDDKGWPLYVTSVEPDNWHPKVPGGGAYPFGFIIRPAPQAMTNAVVAFASKDNPPPRMHMRAICNGGVGFAATPNNTH